jgi:hypothetical protein
MSKPWEMKDYAEMEARLAAAHQLRRDELGPWVASAWHAIVEAIASIGAPHRPEAPRHRHAA